MPPKWTCARCGTRCEPYREGVRLVHTCRQCGHGRHDCRKCGEDAGNFYMVRDEVWVEAVGDQRGLLHLDCLEELLGRRLEDSDFTDCPANSTLMWGLRRGREQR